MTDSPKWDLNSHGADVGVRGAGTTLAEAFEAVALPLTSTVCEASAVHTSQRIGIDMRTEWRISPFGEVAGLAHKVARLQPLVCIKG